MLVDGFDKKKRVLPNFLSTKAIYALFKKIISLYLVYIFCANRAMKMEEYCVKSFGLDQAIQTTSLKFHKLLVIP